MGPKLKNLKKISQKEERSPKYINQRKKDSYLADDNNFEKFSKQLSKIGLELRDITGDGNCLFRALSDQLEGNEGNHLLYRKQACEYMRRNRLDFEPFVVGLVEEIEHRKRGSGGGFEKIDKNLDPFERYVCYLEQSTSYGGNDCLVAFSRLHEVDIFLHQIDQPCWKVNGAFINSKNVKQIHLAYHNGEHYSSVRKMGDLENTPANIQINSVDNTTNTNKTNNNNQKKKNYSQGASYYEYNDNDDYFDDTEELINQIDTLNIQNTNTDDTSNKFDQVLDDIMNVTNCFDINLIKEIYNENNCNVDLTIQNLLNILNTSNENDKENEPNDESVNKNSRKSRNTNLKPREKKQLKKQKQMERQRLKVFEERENERNQNGKINNCKDSNENSNSNEPENENVFNIASSIEAKSI
jgi:OTU domain-containing protein 3